MKNPVPNIQMLIHAPSEIRSLRAIIRDWDPDVVVVSNLLMPHAAIAAQLESRAVVWQIVDTAVPRSLQLLVMPMVRRWADAVVYGGARLEGEHLGTKSLKQPSFVVSPPVDTVRFRADLNFRTEVRKELGIDQDALVVGQVVALNPKKGLEYFLRAMAILVKKRSDVCFLIVGAAQGDHVEYSDELKRLQAELGLSDRQVLWIGDRSDTERFYAAMDVFTVSSVPKSEGTTTTAMEALACEVPVVATDVGAVSEVVVHGENGYLVMPNNPEALARHIELLLGDEKLRQELGAAGRRRTTERFDVDVCVERYVGAFEGALKYRAVARERGSSPAAPVVS